MTKTPSSSSNTLYKGSRDNVVGILYAKDLVLVNPLDAVELTTLLSFRGQQVGRIYAHEQLDHVLQVCFDVDHMFVGC